MFGAAFGEDEDVKLNTYNFSVEGIDEWVGITGINAVWNMPKRTATITYEPPENICINLPDGMQLSIMFAWSLPGSPCLTEAKVTQKTFFQLKTEKPRIREEFASVASKIVTLLCFGIDKIVSISLVTGTSTKLFRTFESGKSRSVKLQLYYPSLPFNTAVPQIQPLKMLFTFADIQEIFEVVCTNWFHSYETISPSLGLYFSTLDSPGMFLEAEFLALAQCIESYHRRTSDEKLMDDIYFTKLTELIISNCPDGNKQWLTGRLQHGNEVNLRKRIKQTIAPFKKYFGTNKVRESLVENIVTTRNYLTHFDEGLETKAAQGEELWELTEKLEAIFQLNLLQDIGFDKSKIESLINNNQAMQYKLRIIKSK